MRFNGRTPLAVVLSAALAAGAWGAEPRRTFDAHHDAVACLAYAPDGKVLATGGKDGTLKLWDVASGKERADVRKDAGTFQALAFSPDGKTLAAGGADGKVRLWDAAGLMK